MVGRFWRSRIGLLGDLILSWVLPDLTAAIAEHLNFNKTEKLIQ
ncbi:MAG: hypothetical protein ACRC62_05305 [Microcoleus sp.]